MSVLLRCLNKGHRQLSGLFTGSRLQFWRLEVQSQGPAGSVLSGGREAGCGPAPLPFWGFARPSLVARSWTIPIHLHVAVSCFHACLQVSSVKRKVVMLGQGLPGGAVVKNPPARAGGVRAVGSTPGSEDPLEVRARGSILESGRSPGRGHGNTPGFLLGESYGQGLVGCSPWSQKLATD